MDMSMNRRGVIEAIGVGGLTVLAGCSSNSSNEQSEQGEDNTPTQTATEVPAPAKFDGTAGTVEYHIPQELGIGERATIKITIHNTGERSGDFSAPLYVRDPEDGEWQVLQHWEANDVPPGNSVKMETPADGITKFIQFDHIRRVQYRLGELSKSPVIQITPANLSWGEQYTTPEGYIIGINQPSLQDTYEHKKFGYTVSAEPDDGNQWVFVNAYVKNETGQTALSPFGSDFVLIYDNSQVRQNYDDSPFYDPINQGDEFEVAELQPGIERSGWIAYQIPSNISASDLTIAWSKTTFNGEIVVNWGSG